LAATSLRCQARIVSGVTSPAEVQQRLSADSLARDSEPTPLVIGQPDPSLAQLFEEDAVLLPQEVDRRLLVPIDPACECCEEDLPGLKGVSHEPIVGIYDPRQQLPLRSGGR
jgi:hypothetical protein